MNFIKTTNLTSYGKRMCAFYDKKVEYNTILVTIIAKYLKLNHKIICISNRQLLLQLFKSNKSLKPFYNDGQIKVYANENYLIEEFDGCTESVLIIEDKSPDQFDIDELIKHESLLHKLVLENHFLSTLSIYNINELSFVLLNKVLELYPYYSIGSVEYLNQFYVPMEYFSLNGLQKELQIFNYKLTKLQENNKTELQFQQIPGMKKVLHKLAHDLKSPIRRANIMNSLIQNNQIVRENSEAMSNLIIMANSLAEAYEKINELEKLAQENAA